MGILFVGDDVRKPAQLWVRRILDQLQEEISTLAVISNPGPVYGPRHSIIRLKDRYPFPQVHLFHRSKIREHGYKKANAFYVLEKHIASPKTSVVFVQYLLYAHRWRAAWASTDKPVWVYCHNHECHWHFLEKGKIDFSPNVRFIANSEATKQQLLRAGVSEEKIVVQGLGIPSEGFTPRENSSTKVNILFLGRLVECKRPDLVIKAFERACELGLEGTLTIAGYGPLEEKCALLCSASPVKEKISMEGAYDHERGMALRKRADIFTAHNMMGVKIPEEETFGVAFIEAMERGIPVVTTSSGALPEIIRDEENGLLVPKGDVEAHAKALVRLAQNPALRKRLGEAGRRLVEEHFTLAQTSKCLKEILASDIWVACE